MIEYGYGDGIEVALGGGWRSFYKCETVAPDGGLLNDTKCRKDGRDLTKEWQNKYNNSAYVTDRTQLKNIDANKVDHLLGISCDSIRFLTCQLRTTDLMLLQHPCSKIIEI